mgnify:CR=1 FL=1
MKKKEEKIKLPVKKSLTLTLLLLSIFEAACIIIQAAFLGKAIGESIMKAYSTDRIVKDDYELIHGNSYTIIKELKQNNIKVDHIITDPPYNISKDNNFNTMNNPRKGVDFGAWDKEFDLYNWIEDYSSILNKNGSMIIFCSYRYISFIIEKLESCNMVVKDILIWKKTNPMPRNIDRRYVQDTEFAVWAVKEKAKWVFNKPNNTPYLRSCYETSTVSGKERTSHPTQKSLKLMESIILIHTNPGDVILDPFMGSGSTGVAALKNNRKFIGIEIEKEYFDIAIDRFKDFL